MATTGSGHRDNLRVLIACCLLSMVMGSIHGFSIYLDPLQQELKTTRSQTSFTYSAALLMLTMGLLTGYRWFGSLRPLITMFLLVVIAATGLWVSTMAESVYLLWFGYSLVFALANGMSYGYALQFPAQVYPGNQGLVMGLVTALYAIGAAVTPLLVKSGLQYGGWRSGMLVQALFLLSVLPMLVLLLSRNAVRFQIADRPVAGTRFLTGGILPLWFGYGLTAMSGLMILGHAVAVIDNRLLNQSLVVFLPAVVALSSIPGSVLGGWLLDRFGPATMLYGLPVALFMVLTGLIFAVTLPASLTALGLVGFLYGCTIVVYPAAIAHWYGAREGGSVYSRVFTAWGIAGLLGPWLAGTIYDITLGYHWAFAVSALVSLVALIPVRLMISNQSGFNR